MEPESTHWTATFLSVVALVIGLVVSAGLLLLASLMSLCSTFGETCTPSENRQISLVSIGALVTFLGVPALVAVARRDARWFYAPFIEVIVVMSIATVGVALG
ncbi:MAG TPA: hypothetical protein VF228_25025 [Iamia sp.]